MKKALIIYHLIIYLWIIFSAMPIFSEQTYKFELMWGSLGTGDGQFNRPTGVAVDASGNVYVADWQNQRIQKFDSNGNFITKFGWGGLNVAIDPLQNVYVTFGHSIQKFDSNGNFITEWGGFYDLIGIAADLSGNVYITDGHECSSYFCLPPYNFACVQVFDSNGNFINEWGSYGSRNGQFKSIAGIAVNRLGQVYVADWNDRGRIQKFDSNAKFITKWGSTGTNDGQFAGPSGIAIDLSGNVYVADTGNYRVQKFDPNGKFITKWGSHGSSANEFDWIYSLTIDVSGNVYVADTYNNRIQKFSPVCDLTLDLTGQWTTLVQICRDTRQGKKCRISGNLSVQNIGNKDAPSSLIRFYLSDDGQYDKGMDTFLKQVATGTVKAEGNMIKTLRYNFPLGETASGKYIIAVIDADSTVTESNKGNNDVAYGPIP